jgi:hypothetical protein
MICKKCGKKKYYAMVCPYCGHISKGGHHVTTNKKANDRRQSKINEKR